MPASSPSANPGEKPEMRKIFVMYRLKSLISLAEYQHMSAENVVIDKKSEALEKQLQELHVPQTRDSYEPRNDEERPLAVHHPSR